MMYRAPGSFDEARHDFSRELEIHGVRLPLDGPDAVRIVTPAILDAILTGSYEAREAGLLPEVVAPGDRVLEIGAGIGVISSIVARQPGVERIVAVEANPYLIPYIRRVHEMNGVRGVRVLNAVLGESEAREMTFFLRENFWMSSLAPGPEPYVEEVEVPARSLNAILREEAISLVICDVEGAEAALFDGVDLSGVDRVYLELHDHLTGVSGIARVFAAMAAAGLGYDPRGSAGPVVLFRRLVENEPPRAYRG